MFPVHIRETSPRRLAALRHTGSFEEIGATFGQICQILEERSLLSQAGCMIGVYWDNPCSRLRARCTAMRASTCRRRWRSRPPSRSCD